MQLLALKSYQYGGLAIKWQSKLANVGNVCPNNSSQIPLVSDDIRTFYTGFSFNWFTLVEMYFQMKNNYTIYIYIHTVLW